jgi:hypothetical protein
MDMLFGVYTNYTTAHTATLTGSLRTEHICECLPACSLEWLDADAVTVLVQSR